MNRSMQRPPRLSPAQLCLLNDLAHGAVVRNVGYKVEAFFMGLGDRKMRHTGNGLSFEEFAALRDAVPQIEPLWRVGSPTPVKSSWRVYSANRGTCLDLVQECLELPHVEVVKVKVEADELADADARHALEMCHAG